MKSLRIIATCAIAVALIVGCTEQNTPTESAGPSVDPSFGFLNGPENPGMSGVYRYQDGLWFLGTNDPTTDLLVWHLAAEDWWFCDGTEGPPDFDIQNVTNPQGVHDALVQLAKADDLPIYIYRWSEFANSTLPWCEKVTDLWLYKGTHRMVYNDNDWNVTGSRGNSYHWNAHGTVYDPDGNEYRYQEQQHCVIRANGSFKCPTENIRIR